MSTSESPDRLERVIGHRGASMYAPENTLAGLRTAACYGARWVEFDVRLTGCGRLVLMHDAELHRTTNGAGPVIAYSLASLAALDAGSWFGGAFAGERIPVFEEALALCTELGLSVHVEVKSDDAHAAASAREVARVLAAVPHREVVLSSMTPAVLEEGARVLPAVPRALGLEVIGDDWPERARELGCSAVHMDHEVLDDARLEEVAERRGELLVRAFTVNLPGRAEQLFGRGIDAVFTDDPGRLLAPAVEVTRSGSRDRSRDQRHPPAA